MDYKKTAEAIKLCGSTPKVDQCKRCVYWSGGDMSECIPKMTEDAAAAMTDLLSRAEAAEARCALLDEARENANEACAKWEGMYRMALERAEKAEKDRDAAVQTIFQWTGCPECRFWAAEDSWCEKHDREAGSSDGCDTPEWRGTRE